MFEFDRGVFFRDFTMRTGLALDDGRREALDFLLGKLGGDQGFTMLREIAYVLATIHWETARTFRPIRERRFSHTKSPQDWEKQTVYWKTGFYGRGFVQLPWRKNYARAGRELQGTVVEVGGSATAIGPDTFVKVPDLVLQPEPAYLICTRGMREGWFTGKKLGDYIKEGEPPDYQRARRIVNGDDHAEDIEAIALRHELLLRAAGKAT